MIGPYNTIRPRKPINGFSWSHEGKHQAVFRIDDFNNGNSRDVTVAMPITGDIHIKSKNKSTSAPVTKKLLYQVENYCDNATLHGLRYIGDPSLSLCERLFWFCSFGIAACLAGYFISNIYIKWSESPVIISFSPSDADLNSIPFPSITICNMNQANKQEAEKIIATGTPAQKKLLKDYCKMNSESNETEYETDWDTMQNFLVTVGQSCSDMLKTCLWKNELVDCDEYFNNDLTDEGLCCSFNRLPPNKIYWNPKSLSFLNQTYSNYIYDWNPEDGFPEKITAERSEYIPRRPLGAGQHLGLSITLDTQVDNYYCSSTASVGFKIVLSNPIETPRTADFGFLLSPGVEARYIINPVIREATDSLRGVPIYKRNCYFSNERRLQYFRSYTLSNCLLECQSNYTFRQCACIPYFLPQSKGRRICAKRDDQCVREAQDVTSVVYGRSINCDCLPSCTELSFTKSGTSSKLHIDSAKKLNYTWEYIRDNINVLHFYFFYTTYGKELKSELHGFTDFLSNTGGLLGVFLGFSILSLVECFYHMTLKFFCSELKSWRKIETRKKAQTHIHPFIQTYTERNCRLECMSNYTNERCGCIPYFLPKNKQVTTCSKKQAKCQQEAKSTVELSSEASQEIMYDANCKCLPGCFEVTYKKIGTYSSLGSEYYLNASQEKTNYDKKNIAIAHFFFENSKFSKQVKSEVFGFTDVVSSCGGLLSLFVGFSLLSLIEFVYFATLRLLCKKMRRHRSRPSFMTHVLK